MTLLVTGSQECFRLRRDGWLGSSRLFGGVGGGLRATFQRGRGFLRRGTAVEEEGERGLLAPRKAALRFNNDGSIPPQGHATPNILPEGCETTKQPPSKTPPPDLLPVVLIQSYMAACGPDSGHLTTWTVLGGSFPSTSCSWGGGGGFGACALTVCWRAS
jgi:hypothetical protein